LEQVDILINLAGRSVDCRYNPTNRDQILRSCVDSTNALGNAMQAACHPPRLWLNASTATIYRHTFDRPMDEASGEWPMAAQDLVQRTRLRNTTLQTENLETGDQE
jgi:uncharacterized protein